MKKSYIVLLLVAVMVFTMTGCCNVPFEVGYEAPVEVIKSGSWEFEKEGVYYVSRMSQETKIHNFAAPNGNIAVYEFPGPIYLVGERVGNNRVNYATKMYFKDSKFIGLSDKYLLLDVNGEMLAVTIEPSDEENVGVSLIQEIPFDELSDSEKDAFVYPVTHSGS